MDIKRKKVGRVGSGAFSIYLPKKWIDSWPPDQQESREVDLHLINDSLLLVPAHLERHETHQATGRETIRRILRSAYVRGLDGVAITPSNDPFSADTIAASRDLLRHLDERLTVTCTPDCIGFTLDPDRAAGIPDGHELLRSMGMKVHDMIELCAEAVDTHQVDPERSLHAMRLMAATQKEDVERLLFQAVRMVARIDVPMATVTDLQALDLLASELERIGAQLMRIAEALLDDIGLTVDSLEYPLEHLLKEMKPQPARSPMVKDLVYGHRKAFEALQTAFQATMAAMREHDVDALTSMQEAVMAGRDEMVESFFATIGSHWGDETNPPEAAAAFTMSRIASLLAGVAHILNSMNRHGSLLLTPRDVGA